MIKDPKHVEIIEQETVYKGHLSIDTYTITHDKFSGGTVGPIKRELVTRPDAVAVIPYDPVRDKVILIKQFRLAAHVNPVQSGWLWEVVAGIVDGNQSTYDTAIRETYEETGLKVDSLKTVHKVYLSPGYSTETIELFYTEVDATQANGEHGLENEGEDIQVQALPWAATLELINNNQISNAITLIALQWLQLHRNSLRKR